MAYLRDRKEELTGFQEGCPFRQSFNVQCDFVMVYGVDDTMPERIRQFKEQGYVVHLMTGVSWGQYQAYLDGKWDGREHWDEGQTGRDGKKIIHNPTVPYMVPTVSFSDFLTQRLLRAVDAGVEAVHMEEPEFWDGGGYSEAFKREYQLYYREPWQPPHTSLDVRYKASKLKAYLYARTIGRISASLKEYAMVKYGRVLRFYVPTHSLVNYTQWKIMSPEGALIDIPTLDGYIAQVWTGTSRSGNVYEGIYRERTFETAFLEYGIMQELVKGSGRRMWFLHDPIEDRPSYTWENFRYNYLKTAVASLLHPQIHRYEICPWPHRVFEGVFPRYQPNIALKDETSYPTKDAKAIPESYGTLLSGMFQLFGDMEQGDGRFEGVDTGVGILMSDSGLFQRTFPDGIVRDGLGKELESVLCSNEGGEIPVEASRRVMKKIGDDEDCYLDFVQSGAFPHFFGLSLPLLKYGLPVRPVLLDNVRRFAGYLDDYANLILSYEYMKPESPDVNAALAVWVRNGGTLFYIGDGSDPYHAIESWWKKAGYENPAQHLFEMLGLRRRQTDGVYAVGKGKLCLWGISPARLCLGREAAGAYRGLVRENLNGGGAGWVYQNHITLRRGPYVISSVMDESCSDERKVFRGLFADLLENGYNIIHEKSVGPDENALLFDFAAIQGQTLRVVGSSARVLELEAEDGTLKARLKTAEGITAYIRLRLPGRLVSAKGTDEDGVETALSHQWDEETRTALISYRSSGKAVAIAGGLGE